MTKIEKQRDNDPRGQDHKSGSAESAAVSASEGKLFPPSSEVEVPRMPPKVDASAATQSQAGDVAAPDTHPAATPGYTSRPAKIDTTESNWADSTQPAPDKRTARSSIL